MRVNGFKQIYSAIENGFSGQEFHEKCDNQGSTFIITKSESGKIFGGYTDIPWSKNHGYAKGKSNSFIFSLKDD